MKNIATCCCLVILPILLSSCAVDRPFYLRSWEKNRLGAAKARTQHHYQTAERLAQSAVAEAEHLGSSDFRLAVSLYDLAGIYILQEKFKYAVPLVDRALQVLQSASTKSSALIDREIIQQERARVLLMLGDLDYRRHHYEKALSDYQSASKLLEQWCAAQRLESGNPLGMEFVRSIWGQAEAQFALDKHDLAEKNFVLALRLAEANAYPFARDLQARYGDFLQDQGRQNVGEMAADKWRAHSAKGREEAKKKHFELARQHFLKALQEASQFRPDDVRLAATYKNIGDMCTRLGDSPGSEFYSGRALAVCISMGQPVFALTDDLLQEVAAVKLILGKFDECERTYREDLALREKHYGTGERTAEVFLQLAELEMYRDKNKEQQHVLAVHALDVLLKDHGTRRKTASFFQRLCALFTNMHDYSRAQLSMDEAMKIWKDRMDLRGERISSNFYRLALLAAMQGKDADEKAYLVRAAEALKPADSDEFVATARLIRKQLQESRTYKNGKQISDKLHNWMQDLLHQARLSALASDPATTKTLAQIAQDSLKYGAK